MENISYENMGAKIRAARVSQHLSQEQLAEACNLSASFLGHIERGTRKMSLETLFVLCTVLELNPNFLLFDHLIYAENNLVINLSTLNTKDAGKKQRFVNAVNALAESVDKL